jgi:hypothetical protein
MKKPYTILFLMLFAVLSITNVVFADDSSWARHKAEGLPNWALWTICIVTVSIVFCMITLILPPYVIKPFLEWRKKKKGL